MRILFILLTFFLHLSCLATDLKYNSYTMVPAPLELSDHLTAQLREEGFLALAEAQYGLPSLGINQAYYRSETQFVLVKYGVTGQFPLDEIISTPTGFLVHKKLKNETVMLYFRGLNQTAVKLILNRLPQKVSSYRVIQNLLIPQAEASECGDTAFGGPILSQANQLAAISAEGAWNFLKGCLPGLGEGLKESTVGAVTGAAATVVEVSKEVWEAASHPIDYVENIANKVELFLVKSAQFIKGLVTDPEKTMKAIGKGLGTAWDGVVSTVTSMSYEMKLNFVCSMIASLGFDAALTLLTGGAASEKLILTINNISRKFSMVGKIMKVLNRLHSAALSKLNLHGEKLEKFMKGLFSNHYPENDLLHLDELAHMSDELSLRTLSCYIR